MQHKLLKWKGYLLFVFAGLQFQAVSQPISSISLEEVQEWSAAHFPLLKKKVLSRQEVLAANEQLRKNFLPQVNLSAQASWQSDVTALPIESPLPGLDIPVLSRDQYRAVADVSQLIYDGGATNLQKDVNILKSLLQEQEVNVGLQQLKEKINSLYLNALFLEEQKRLLSIVLEDIEAGLKKVEAQVENGTAFRSNLALLKSEKLKILQRDMELSEDKSGILQTLSLLTGKEIDPEASLSTPLAEVVIADAAFSNRAEISLYHLQDSLAARQTDFIESRLKPKISLFANGGYGRPGLNMLKNEFSPFITTGLRINWNLGALYTQKKEREIIEINRENIQVQKENFLLNTQTQLVQQQTAIRKLQRVIASDTEIIALKSEVKQSAKAQLDNGVITTSDYLREVHAEEEARQNKALHQLQLLQAQIQLKTISGN